MNNYKINMLKPLVRINESISNLRKSAGLNVGLSKICDKYESRLNEGCTCEELCDDFCNDIAAVGLGCCKKEVANLKNQESLEQHNIDILKEFHRIGETDKMLYDALEPKLVTYLTSKTEDALRDVYSVLDAIGMNANSLTGFIEALKVDSYAEKILGKSCPMELKDDYVEEPEELYTRADVEALVNKALAKQKEAKAAEEVVPVTSADARDYVRLQQTISALERKEPKNGELRAYCESYSTAMRNGQHQEALFESFINGLSQWNYLNAVDTEMSALKDRTTKYKQEIDLTHILKIMNESSSYYIVPLIEECVVNYINNKNGTTRAMLIHNLNPFMHDPFVKDMMNVVCNDMSIDTLYTGHNIELNTSDIKTQNIYSPVKYIKENESIFNVDGTYYTRKGNTIAKLGRADIANLNESFKHACVVMNRDNVKVDNVADCIYVYGDKDTASINDFGIKINGQDVRVEDLNNPIYEGYGAFENGHEFYDSIRTIHENYSTIANIDFGKRVESKNNGKSVDIFKLRGALSIALNEDGNTTFYRNVNPIQCKNYMNEHMNVNVSKLFEGDMLPGDENMEKECAEAKQAYECYLKTLKDKKDELQRLCDSEEVTDEDSEAVKNALDLVNKEIEDVTKDYKDYQTKSDEYLGKVKDDSKKDKTDSDILDVSNDVDSEVTEPITEPGDDGAIDAENPEMGDDSNIDGFDDDAFEMPEYTLPDDEESGEITMDNVDPTEITTYDSVLDMPGEATANSEGFNIISVSFNKNIKNDTISKNGVVHVLIPTVNANGDIHNEVKAVSFTLGEDKKPVLNNDDTMPVDMYTAITNAIAQSPDIENVDMGSDADTTPAEQPEGLESPLSSVSGDDAALPEPADDSEISEPAEETPEFSDEPETIDSLNAENGTESVDNQQPEDSSVDASENTDESAIEEEVVTPILSDEQVPSDDDSALTVVPDLNSDSDADTVNLYEFPIQVPFNGDEIRKNSVLKDSFDFKDFQAYLDSKRIDHIDNFGSVEVVLDGKVDVWNLMNYFVDNFGIDSNVFFSWLPDLKPLCESVYHKIKNNKIFEAFEEGEIAEFELPYESVLYDELADNGFELVDGDDESEFYVRANDEKEYENLCDLLIDYRESTIDLSDEMDEAIYNILNNSTDIQYQYDGEVANELSKNNIDYDVDGDVIDVPVESMSEALTLVKIGNKLNIKPINESALRHMLFEGEADSKKEGGVIITVEDTNTHKKVTIDTSNLNGKEDKEEKDENEDGDGAASFGDDTQLYDTQEDAEEAKKDNEQGNANPGQPQQEAAAPKKKTFKFVPKKKSATFESAVTPKGFKLNEAVATPAILDKVVVDGKVGQIYGKRTDGNYLVLIQGSTVICEPNTVKAMYPREDSLECNFKYDPKTLKGIYEQAIPCVVENNGINESLYCKCGDYLNGKKTGTVTVYNQEGKNLDVNITDVRLKKDIKDFNNAKDYSVGYYTKDNDDSVQYGVYYNTKDYNGNTGFVRCLKLKKNGETNMVNLPSYAITPLTK